MSHRIAVSDFSENHLIYSPRTGLRSKVIYLHVTTSSLFQINKLVSNSDFQVFD